jgi:hypothetical protein
VILGGLVELAQGTGDDSYTQLAMDIANAVIASPNLNPNGVLYEYGCEGGGGNCQLFKINDYSNNGNSVPHN